MNPPCCLYDRAASARTTDRQPTPKEGVSRGRNRARRRSLATSVGSGLLPYTLNGSPRGPPEACALSLPATPSPICRMPKSPLAQWQECMKDLREQIASPVLTAHSFASLARTSVARVPGRMAFVCRDYLPPAYNTSAQLWSDRSQRRPGRAGTLRRRLHPRSALTSVRLKHRRGVPCPRREIRQRRLVGGEGELLGRPVEHGWLKASGAEPMYPPAPSALHFPLSRAILACPARALICPQRRKTKAEAERRPEGCRGVRNYSSYCQRRKSGRDPSNVSIGDFDKHASAPVGSGNRQSHTTRARFLAEYTCTFQQPEDSHPGPLLS